MPGRAAAAAAALWLTFAIAVAATAGASSSPRLFGIARGGGSTCTFDEPATSMEWTELPSLELGVSTGDDDVDSADLVIIGVYADKPSSDEDDERQDDNDDDNANASKVTLTGRAKALDESLAGSLTQIMADNAKKFKGGAVAGTATPTMRISSNGRTRRYVLVGLGKADTKDDSDSSSVKANALGRKIGTSIALAIQNEKGISSCAIILPSGQIDGNPSCLTAMSTAFTEKLYTDNRYRTGSNVKKIAENVEKATLFIDGVDESSVANDPNAFVDALADGRKIASGTFLAKDIVNSPHNTLNSLSLADTAQRIASESNGFVECNILEKDDCEHLGMGAYLGVARGSETPPKFICLTYKPKSGKINKKLGVVGKGLLFDTGGYNIKTAGMHQMKFDCGGAAAVLGAARAIAALAPEGVEVNIIVAACENMINDRAVVPGDVLTASNGKTIEVENTDAEGRLTMADALVYADKELGCDKIIELSTLTGACMVALGNKVAGLWAKSDDLVNDLLTASKVTGEKIWHMPLEKEYNDSLKSKIADLKNLGGRYGGAITAALFLQNFVGKKTPYAHIDIAGPVWSDKEGATGFGSRLVTEWVCSEALRE